ncbi:MAG: hypothetical protein KY455_08295 [Euryarchaeota archaeon]|nr:hypothetical protein [Euryarchaeota archaeon]
MVRSPSERSAPRSDRVPAFLLVAILTLGVLLVLPTGAAQGPGSDTHPPRDTSLLEGVQNVQTLIEDPKGDEEIFFGDVAGPETPWSASGDILSLSVAETSTRLLFSLKHRGYDSTASQTSEYMFGAEHSCRLSFSVDGDVNTTYRLEIIGDRFLDGGDLRYGASASVRSVLEEDDGRTQYASDHLGNPPAALVAGDHLEAVFEKTWLSTGKHASAPGEERAPPQAGTELTGFDLSCTRRFAFIGYSDDIDSENVQPYRIMVASANEHIRLHLDGATQTTDATGTPMDALTAVPGKTRTAVVGIENLQARKIIVNLTTRTDDGDGGSLDGWKITLVPTLEVRARNLTEARLVVVPPADAAHRSGGWLHIDARVLGRDAVATRTIRLVANAPLGPDNDILHFHPAPADSGCFLGCDRDLVETPVRLLGPWGGRFILNPLEDDPLHPDDAGDGSPVPFLSDSDLSGGLDMPLAQPIRFDPERPITVTLGLSSKVPRDIDVEVLLFSDDDIWVGGAKAETAVDAAPQDVSLDIRVREEALDVCCMLWALLQVRETGPAAIMGNAWVAHVGLHPDRSQIALPLLEHFEPELQVTDGRAFPTIQLVGKQDPESFVNPGKRTVFDLQLVNEGTERDDLQVDIDLSDPRWAARLEPCCRYRLDPGGTAPFSLILQAPADAGEGEVVIANLSAKSRNDSEVRTSISLRAIVTDGIGIEDEDYIPSEESVEPLDETRESPTVPPVALAIGLVAIAAMRRRRLP